MHKDYAGWRHEADLASELATAGIALANRTSSYKYVALNQALLGMAHAQQGRAHGDTSPEIGD
ncbi:MAG: hypothetical protein R2838_23940 [Caldilineaceae bacterium]